MKTEKETFIDSNDQIQTPETLAVNLEKDVKEGKADLFNAFGVTEMWKLRKTFRSASDMRRSRN